MIEALLLFTLGLTILLFSTQKFVDLATKLSRIIGISPLIIGVTLVAIGTSLPELAVSLIAIYRQDGGLALGNIVGSNIVNVLLVLPIGILVGGIRIGTSKTQTNATILLACVAIFIALRFFGIFQPIIGILLISLSVVIGFFEYKIGINGRAHEDSLWFKRLIKKEKFSKLEILSGVILLGSILAGSSILVESVEKIAKLTNISTTILGLTITAIATSLPEILATVFSQKSGQEKIAVGNIIGSNIYNLMLVGGIIMLFPTKSYISIIQWGWLIGTTFLFTLIINHYSGKRPTKIVAAALIGLLIVYLYSQSF